MAAEEEPEATLDRQLQELRALARAQPQLAGRIVEGVSSLVRPVDGSDAGS
jgi:hypothetical protein